MRDYDKVISSLGCEFSYWCENGGYTDRDPNDGMPRSKEYKVMITFDDGMVIGGYIKLMACGTVEDPFSAYDTCIILWPRKQSELGENRIVTVSTDKIRSLVRESLKRIYKDILQ